MEQRILSKILDYEEYAIELQRGLVSIPAISPETGGEGELDKAVWLEGELDELPFDEIFRVDAPDPEAKGGVRPNLVARWRGVDSKRTLWIMGHLDVVPPGEEELWTTDPFELHVEGRKLYGRGVEDNHQGVIGAILAVKAMMAEGYRPPHDVALLFAADEETGSCYGADYLVENYPEMFDKHDSFIVPDAGKPDGGMVEIAEKSLLWIRVRTRGRQCHSSLPEAGRNAFSAASELVVRLTGLRKIFDRRDPLFGPPLSTFEPTKKEPNVTNINTIPGEDVFYLDCRILPGYTLVEVKAAMVELSLPVAKKHDVTFEFEVVQELEAPPPTSLASPIVREILRAIKTVYGIRAEPKGIGGGTVAASFRKLKLPAVVFSKLNNTAHKPDECCDLDNLLGDSMVFALTAIHLKG